MFSSLTDPFKIGLSIAIGLIVGALLAWGATTISYEGLRMPFFGWQIVDGKIAREVKAATKDLVAAADLTAARAELDKAKADAAKADALRQMAERNIQSLMQQDEDDAKDLAAHLAADEGADGARYTAADIERMPKRPRGAR